MDCISSPPALQSETFPKNEESQLKPTLLLDESWLTFHIVSAFGSPQQGEIFWYNWLVFQSLIVQVSVWYQNVII